MVFSLERSDNEVCSHWRGNDPSPAINPRRSRDPIRLTLGASAPGTVPPIAHRWNRPSQPQSYCRIVPAWPTDPRPNGSFFTINFYLQRYCSLRSRGFGRGWPWQASAAAEVDVMGGKQEHQFAEPFLLAIEGKGAP